MDTLQGKELQVAKRRKGRYPNEFRRMAVERLKRCENIVALSEELGVHRRLLYKWRDQLDPADIADEPLPENPRESTLRKEVSQLKRLLAEKTVDAITSFETALTWPETQQRIQNLLQRGLQRDSDFETRWPEVLGSLLET
jgi:transposase-like protein